VLVLVWLLACLMVGLGLGVGVAVFRLLVGG
jgi:hypothetical protein